MNNLDVGSSDLPDIPGNGSDFSTDTEQKNIEIQPVKDITPETDEDLEVIEIGAPDELAYYWRFQGDSNDCGLYAQGGILEANGKDFELDDYRERGMKEGWYTPKDGTDLEHYGDLLEENGMPVDRYLFADFQDMADALSEGKGVAVAVDCEPIWGQPGGHALWVTGMEVAQDGTPLEVICNDSGREDGCGIAYTFEAFQKAWAGSGNLMVVTKDPLAVLS